MKYAFLFVLLFSTSVFANGASVADLAAQLGKIAAMGVTEYQVQGSGEKDLLLSYLNQTVDLNEDSEIYFNHSSIELFDEFVFGTTDAKNFSSIITGAIHFMDEDAIASEVMYPQSSLALIKEILAQLQKHNVIYSWNPSGDYVCGMMLTTPVLIDPQTQKAYEFNYFKIAEC